MRYLNAMTVMGLMAMAAAETLTPSREPLRLDPKPQPPQPPRSKRQAELTARADRRRARRNGEA